MAKPTDVGRWGDVSAAIVVPSSGKKDVGWVPADRPAAQYRNYLDNIAWQWRQYVSDGILEGAFGLASAITPAALSANTDDYNPAGLATAQMIRQAVTTPINLTGLLAGVEGRIIVLQNNTALPGTDAMTLVHESGSSAAANRFFLASGANLAIPPIGSVILRYTGSRWFCIGKSF